MLPFAKKSKMRKRTRRAHHALRATQLIACRQCGQAKLPHAACANCGYVNAHTRIDVDTDKS